MRAVDVACCNCELLTVWAYIPVYFSIISSFEMPIYPEGHDHIRLRWSALENRVDEYACHIRMVSYDKE